jgi:hypothetical protein
MNDKGSFVIDGWAYKVRDKSTGWVLSDKSLVENAQPEDSFEKKTIIISRNKIRELYEAMVNEEDLTDAEYD